MTESSFPSAPAGRGRRLFLRDARWTAVAVWAGTLAALLVTSVYGVSAFQQADLFARANASQFGNTQAYDRSVVATFLVSVVAVAALLVAWLAFVSFSRAFVGAFAEALGDDDDEPLVAGMLGPAEAGEEPEAAARAAGSLASVLVPLAVAWAAYILAPTIADLVQTQT